MELSVKAYVKLELHVVIWFLALKSGPAVHIHRKLEQVYGAGCIDVSNVGRWRGNFVNDRHSGLEDEPCSGSPENIKHVRQLLD